MANKTIFYGEQCCKELLRRSEKLNNCFIAGTPVWTDKGLVPIEKLKAGDCVLSRCDKSGEQAYKRVSKAFKTENQEIRAICIDRMRDSTTIDYVELLFATPNHPILVNGHGWTLVDDLWDFYLRYEFGDYRQATFACADNGVARLGWPESLGYPVIGSKDCGGRAFVRFRTIEESDYGYIVNFGIEVFSGKNEIRGYDPFGNELSADFRVIFQGASLEDGKFRWREDYVAPVELLRYSDAVFNIEVEDFNSYFVGESGILVRNAC